VDYNKLQLSRIYPAGSRISSTNYNPQVEDAAALCDWGCSLLVLSTAVLERRVAARGLELANHGSSHAGTGGPNPAPNPAFLSLPCTTVVVAVTSFRRKLLLSMIV